MDLRRYSGRVDFVRINMEALKESGRVVRGLIPDGRQLGNEWVARNPRRDDRKPGSFKVSLSTGKWADFATGDAGGDLISLAAYVTGQTQAEAATNLARALGVDPYARPRPPGAR